MTLDPSTRFGPRPPFRCVEVQGTPRQMGRIHGSEARDLVQKTISLYRTRFETESGLPWDEVLKLAPSIGAAIAEYDPDSLEEMRGIAEGSGHPFEAIVAINSRSEILALGQRREALHGEQECTSAACLPEITGDGHTLLGRNWDQDLRCLEVALVLKLTPQGYPRAVLLTEAGILMREGVNEAGIGVTGNSLSCEFDGRDVLGMPVAVVRRRMLRHTHGVAAAREVFAAARSFSVNHLLADARGFAIDFESAPNEIFWVMPEGGLLVHSNHFLSPRSVRIEDRGPVNNVSTLYRLERVREILGARRGSIRVEDMQEAFRDHFGHPHSVCSHPKDPADSRPSGSVASVVMDLDERRLLVAPHPVCVNEYTEYSID